MQESTQNRKLTLKMCFWGFFRHFYSQFYIFSEKLNFFHVLFECKNLISFFRNSIFEIGSHNFSKSYEPIFFKLCTLLLYNIFYCLNEGFFFLYFKYFFKAIQGANFTKKWYFWFTTPSKMQTLIYFFLRLSTSYKHLLTENFLFFNFRWICHELSWLRQENFFFKGHRRWGPNNWIFKIL